jgi:membrane fusion protein (multidrug efflux system)
VSFNPSAQDLARWRQDPGTRKLVQPGGGLAVRVVLPDGTELERTGRLDYVDPVVDPASGTQEFRARFSNRDRMLLPGQFVRVRPEGFRRDSAIVIPATAVLQDLGRSYVFVVGPGDTVATRGIKPGQWSGERWVIDSGLVAGDRVVVDNVQKIGPGMVVKPVPLSADSAGRAAAGKAGAS